MRVCSEELDRPENASVKDVVGKLKKAKAAIDAGGVLLGQDRCVVHQCLQDLCTQVEHGLWLSGTVTRKRVIAAAQRR